MSAMCRWLTPSYKSSQPIRVSKPVSPMKVTLVSRVQMRDDQPRVGRYGRSVVDLAPMGSIVRLWLHARCNVINRSQRRAPLRIWRRATT